MENLPQKGSRGSGEKRKKPAQTKAKRAAGKQAPEAPARPSLNEVAEKAFKSLSTLGTQTFAIFPFNQYFDDWLKNVRGVVSEFESNPAVAVDEQFVKERSQIFVDVEREFADRRLKENSMQESAKALSDTNHFLAQLDADYASQTHALSQKRNSEIERLTKDVHNLEEALIFAERMKTSLFSPMSKRIKAQKIAETTQKLGTAKAELELAMQNFRVEQEKLHDAYVNKKMATAGKVQELEREITNIETDTSVDARQNACNALINSIKAFIQRKQTSPQKQQ
jgi:hypothetical protein